MTNPVLFTTANQYADLYGGLARDLRARHGIESVLLYLGPSGLPDPRVYDLKPDHFAALIDFEQHITPRPTGMMPPASELSAAALELEQRLGISINEVIRSDRHAGGAFVIGGRYPRTRYARMVSYDQAVDIVLRVAEASEALLREHMPSVVVSAAADIFRSTLIAVAEHKGIPVRIPCASPANTHFQWRVNRYYWPPNLAGAFQATLENTPILPSDRQEAISVPEVDRTRYARRLVPRDVHPLTPIKFAALDIKREAGRILKRRGRIYGGVFLSSALRHRFVLWWQKRRALRAPKVIDRIEPHNPYVFYPMVVEPESTLQSECPMSDNQLAFIDWLAKTMPAGWRLVVKEHPGFTTPRPRYFMDRIAAYPNVHLASAFENGEAFASRARAVAMISGSLGMQAAVAGVPIITFSPTWVGRFLPHVLYADSYASTRSALLRIAVGNDLPALSERRRAARALNAALETGAIELQDGGLLAERAQGKPVPQADVDAIEADLLANLDIPLEWTRVPFAEAAPWQPTLADSASSSSKNRGRRASAVRMTSQG